MSNQTRGILLAMTTAFFWGFLAIALKITVQFVDPYTIVFCRFFIAFTALFLYFLFFDRKAFKLIYKMPYLLPLAGICLGINYLSFLQGVNFSSPSNAQIVIQLGPLLLVVAAIFLYKESLNIFQATGFAIVTLGFIMFYNDQLHFFVSENSTYKTGIMLTALAAVAWTCYAIIQKKLVKTFEPQHLNLFIYGIPALFFVPVTQFSTINHLTFSQILLVLFLGVNTLIAYGCLSASLKYIEAHKVSVIVTLNPIITFLTMGLFEYIDFPIVSYEHFSLLTISGALLALSGAIIVIIFRKRNNLPVKHE